MLYAPAIHSLPQHVRRQTSLSRKHECLTLFETPLNGLCVTRFDYSAPRHPPPPFLLVKIVLQKNSKIYTKKLEIDASITALDDTTLPLYGTSDQECTLTERYTALPTIFFIIPELPHLPPHAWQHSRKFPH